MLFDDLNKANIAAYKERNRPKKDILAIVIGKCKNKIVELREAHQELSDDDVLKILEKTVKELTEEIENYKKASGDYQERIETLTYQRDVVEAYLPQKLTKEEIVDLISTLEDKSIPSVMKFFKENYAGKCDMKLVNEVARNL